MRFAIALAAVLLLSACAPTPAQFAAPAGDMPLSVLASQVAVDMARTAEAERQATAAMAATMDAANVANTQTVANAQAQAEAAAIEQAAGIARQSTQLAFSQTLDAATAIPAANTQQAAYTATQFSQTVAHNQSSDTSGFALGMSFAVVFVSFSILFSAFGLSYLHRQNERHAAEMDERRNMAVANTVRPMGDRLIIFVVNGEVRSMSMGGAGMITAHSMGELHSAIEPGLPGDEINRRAGWRLAARRIAGWSREPGYERQAAFSRDKLCGEDKLNALSYQDYPRLISFLEAIGQVVNDGGGTRYATGRDYDSLMAAVDRDPLPYPEGDAPKVAPVGRTTPVSTGVYRSGGGSEVVLENEATP